MKNNRKKQTSSYLLIFLGIVAALLILIILYLTFFKRDSQRSINLAKNGSATAQTEDFTDGEASGFTSGDETSEDADQSGEFLNFGEEQHHRNTAHKRHDHADKWNKDRDKTDRRRCENDDKVNRRKNTDVD